MSFASTKPTPSLADAVDVDAVDVDAVDGDAVDVDAVDVDASGTATESAFSWDSLSDSPRVKVESCSKN